jgi:hypothetical protein
MYTASTPKQMRVLFDILLQVLDDGFVGVIWHNYHGWMVGERGHEEGGQAAAYAQLDDCRVLSWWCSNKPEHPKAGINPRSMRSARRSDGENR